MTKFKIIAGIFVIFILGLAIGAMGMRFYVKYRIDQFMGTGPPPRIHPRLMAHLDRELHLTPSQRAQVDKIAEALSRDLFAIRLKLRPEIEETIDRHLDRMSDILDTEQQKRLEEFREKMKKRVFKRRFERHHERGRSPNGPPPPQKNQTDTPWEHQ